MFGSWLWHFNSIFQIYTHFLSCQLLRFLSHLLTFIIETFQSQISNKLWSSSWLWLIFSIFPDQVCEAEKDDDNGHALNLKGESPEIIPVSIVSNVLLSSTWLQTPAPLNLSPNISLRNTNLYPLSANLCWGISHLWHKQDYLSQYLITSSSVQILSRVNFLLLCTRSVG